jgi:predicted membrane protein
MSLKKRKRGYGNYLNLLAILALLIWAAAYFVYNSDGFIHLFLAVFVLTLVLRILRRYTFSKNQHEKANKAKLNVDKFSR